MKNCLIKNIFCDRDGTIIHDRHYLSDPQGVELLPGAADGLGRLSLLGKKIFVVTNQSGIGRGMFGTKDYQACHSRMVNLLAKADVTLSGSAFCPHAPEEGCVCRKPETGMWERLGREYGLKPEESVMIGDKPEDIMFGKNAGFAATILVLTGKGRASAEKLGLPPLPEKNNYLALGSRATEVAERGCPATKSGHSAHSDQAAPAVQGSGDASVAEDAAVAEDAVVTELWPDCLAADLNGAAAFVINCLEGGNE